MANVYGLRQWILDTTGVITTDRIRIRKLEWVPNATNDDLAIVDNNSEALWTVTNALTGGRAGLEVLDFGGNGQDFEGFNLTTLGGGTLYVYIS